MSRNQITDIVKRHEEKDYAIANKKKHLSLSSKAYKMFSEGRTNVYVARRLDTSDSGNSVLLGILEIAGPRRPRIIAHTNKR